MFILPGKANVIEWLSSKIGALIVIGVVTAFVLGLFSWQHSMAVDREGQNVAEAISRALDSVGGLEAATVIDMSFGPEGGQLPEAINGRPYSINITEGNVIISSEARIWVSEHVGHVIPMNLESRSFNLTEYSETDFTGSTGEHTSGQNFRIERALIDISGEKVYVTLVYWQ